MDQTAPQHWMRVALRLLVPLAASFLLLGSTDPAIATEEHVIEVAQPIWTENYIGVSCVTYIVMAGSPIPGIEVPWTSKPNFVQREPNEPPANRNAANLYGIDVRVSLDRAMRDFDRQGTDALDTLHVVLDLGHLTTPKELYLPASDVVDATLECILTNTANKRPQVRNVDLEVQGPIEYRKLAKVYRLRDYPKLPRRRMFD